MPARTMVLVALLVVTQSPRASVEPRAGKHPAEGATGAAVFVNELGMRFVEIPAGSFDMGAEVPEWERPVHRVHVKSFWMAVTEVTQAQWQAVMGTNPSHFKKAGPNAPVEMVRWSDAQAFVQKLNARDPGRRYRLSTEAEWEYACRANGKQDPYGPAEEVAWIKDNSGGTTHPVALKRPNAFGLYDMLGNVPEWVQDTWHDSYEGAPDDGSAWVDPGVTMHTLRGGGWDLPAFFLHAGLRGPLDEVHRRGFRLAFDGRDVRDERQESTDLGGPYLGQSPPGRTPVRFAEGIVSTKGRELNAVFTPDGREFYFTVHGEDRRWTIMRMAPENGRWSPPRPASFSGRWSDVDMFITADGRRLYFCSNRPLQGETPKDFDIWVCERSADGWGEPRNVGAPVNSAANEFYPSLTRDGTMYFQSRRPGGPGLSDIWRSRLVDGRYADAECLPSPVNSAASEGDALVAADESYVILSVSLDERGRRNGASAAPVVRRDDATSQAAPPPPPPPAPGLFLSLRESDDSWSPLVDLGSAINRIDAGVNCQMLSPDGRYLFFTRGGDIYWVDAWVVEEAKRRAAAGAR